MVDLAGELLETLQGVQAQGRLLLKGKRMNVWLHPEGDISPAGGQENIKKWKENTIKIGGNTLLEK